MQAINDVMKSNPDPVNGGQITINHGRKKSFGPLQPAANAPPQHFQDTGRACGFEH